MNPYYKIVKSEYEQPKTIRLNNQEAFNLTPTNGPGRQPDTFINATTLLASYWKRRGFFCAQQQIFAIDKFAFFPTIWHKSKRMC